MPYSYPPYPLFFPLSRLRSKDHNESQITDLLALVSAAVGVTEAGIGGFYTPISVVHGPIRSSSGLRTSELGALSAVANTAISCLLPDLMI